jgi:uncharacterized membrane protein YkvA (DUF1232 family)
MMQMMENRRARARSLKKEIVAIYYAYRDPRTPVLAKIVILVTLGYALSPIDLIPDFIPVLGYLDDLVIVPALIALSLRLLPAKVMKEARDKAASETLQLKKNWFFAVLFILIWIALLVTVIIGVIGLLKK